MERELNEPEHCPECWRTSWGGEICRVCLEDNLRLELSEDK